MKKSLRLFGTLLALVSLTACQDLGSEMTEAQAAQRQAEITKDSEEKAAHALTMTMTETVKISAAGESLNGTATIRAACDLDKLYLVMEEKDSATSDGKKQSSEEARYVYYKDGAVHYVTKADGKATGYKVTMTEAEAKLEIAANYGESEYASVDVNTILDGLNAMAENFGDSGIGMKLDQTKKYYSKGEGNLSVKVTQKGSMSAQGVSAKYNLEAVVTVNDYFLSGASLKLNYTASGQGQKASIAVGLNIKGAKGCKIEYPTYTETAQ